MDNRPPPPPPPHGAGSAGPNAKASGLPPGNYDIFVIPPHSSGSGFLYLPSLQPHRNSFLAGVFCTLAVVGVWVVIAPVLRHWTHTITSSGGAGVILLLMGVGVIGWAFGKTQLESTGSSYMGDGSAGTGSQQQNTGGTPFTGPGAGPKPSWQRATPGAAGSWEKAKEETRKKEEERKQKEEAEKKKEELNKKAKEAAEKERWEKARVREREAREKLARERLAEERRKKEASNPTTSGAEGKPYQKPTAQSYVGDDDEQYSFRPYDKPKKAPKNESGSSYFSEASSYAATHSTARTTPPPSHRGPYSNKDPDKITIKAVYVFTDLFPKPVAQLLSGQGSVTDGLILKMTTEGLFIDDDIRGVPQREWDVKAWTMKLVESGELKGKHVLRASVRDTENKKYVFIIDESEAWKVAVGLQRLRRGSQVRSLGVSGLSANDTKSILSQLGWV